MFLFLHVRFLHLLLLITTIPAITSSSRPQSSSYALPGCQSKCGNITIPYPFGLTQGCYRGGFKLTCDNSVRPPKLFLDSQNASSYAVGASKAYEVSNISLGSGELTIKTSIGKQCGRSMSPDLFTIDLSDLPYTLSYTQNKFTAVGCQVIALNMNQTIEFRAASGCMSMCTNTTTFTNNSCNGIGCCQTAIPRGVKRMIMVVQSIFNVSALMTEQVDPCSYAFLVDQEKYLFSSNDILYFPKWRTTVPTMVDWALGSENCSMALKNKNNYACGSKSKCIDSNNGPGYLCSCISGYEGNPYFSKGCLDINECGNSSLNTCSDICINTPGSYTCTCPSGTYGDGRRNGKGCIKENSKSPMLQIFLGIGLGPLFLLVLSSWIYWVVRKRKMLALREKFFAQNGGLFLKQTMSSNSVAAQTMKVFSSEELKKATNNYNNDNILGVGGQGTVYRGTLPDETVVAIKKSKLVDPTQVQQFINEMIVLSQTIHRNIVRLLGCCLETEIPMLVYEFISNGALSSHITSCENDNIQKPSLSWECRLRIAGETAGAIDYLHTAASIPIFHRDIKSANILLDKDFNAKVSDFGISKLVSLEEVQVTTLVQGTIGYLDPSYFQNGVLTEKSDVYSFGVVLVELLTGEKPVSLARQQEERNLASYFLIAMKEKRLFEILESRVHREGQHDQIKAVAEVAKACLRLKPEDRPTMKCVAAYLAQLRSDGTQTRHPWSCPERREEEETLFGTSSSNTRSFGQGTSEDNIIHSR